MIFRIKKIGMDLNQGINLLTLITIQNRPDKGSGGVGGRYYRHLIFLINN